MFPRHNSLKGKHSVLSFQRASDIPKETENLLTLSKFCLYSNCQNNNQISGRESTQWASDIRMEAGSLFAILSWSVFPFLEGPFVSNIVASFLKMRYVLVQVQDPESTCEWVMWGEKFRSLQEFVHFFQVPSSSRFYFFQVLSTSRFYYRLFFNNFGQSVFFWVIFSAPRHFPRCRCNSLQTAHFSGDDDRQRQCWCNFGPRGQWKKSVIWSQITDQIP